MIDSGKNPAKEFYDIYKEQFYKIIETPLVAVSKDNNMIVPYEYSKKQIRYKRLENEVDEVMKSCSHNKLVCYCIKNQIDKQSLLTIVGGNLYLYDNMKKRYSKPITF